jgi:hypothetical protein
MINSFQVVLHFVCPGLRRFSFRIAYALDVEQENNNNEFAKKAMMSVHNSHSEGKRERGYARRMHQHMHQDNADKEPIYVLYSHGNVVVLLVLDRASDHRVLDILEERVTVLSELLGGLCSVELMTVR